jgi:hypothetical protein
LRGGGPVGSWLRRAGEGTPSSSRRRRRGGGPAGEELRGRFRLVRRGGGPVGGGVLRGRRGVRVEKLFSFIMVGLCSAAQEQFIPEGRVKAATKEPKRRTWRAGKAKAILVQGCADAESRHGSYRREVKVWCTDAKSRYVVEGKRYQCISLFWISPKREVPRSVIKFKIVISRQ